MFELSVRGLAWRLDASLKAALVALVAATVLRLLRLHDSNVRHRVWTGVLAGMFLLPVLTPLMPALRLPLLPSPEWLVAWTAEPAAPEALLPTEPGEPITAPPSAQDEFTGVQPQFDRRSRMPFDRAQFPLSGYSSAAAPAASEPAIAAPAPETAPVADPLSQAPPPPLAPRSAFSRRTAAALVVFVFGSVWFVGTSLLLVRLAIGLWLAGRLRRRSQAIDPAVLMASGANAAAVRECSAIHAPLTVGSLRPQILLPLAWRDWPADKLHAVLAHEQMHVQRGDCLVAFLAELNCCLYWFHPLAWWLKQHLAALAEQACDDAAIDSIGNRAQYARHLLEVAAAVTHHRGRLAPTGLSMARRSNVENRIYAILDFTRPLSQRLSWRATLALTAVMAPLILLAAALKPTAGQQQEKPPLQVKAGSQAPVVELPVVERSPDRSTAPDRRSQKSGDSGDLRSEPAAGSGDPRRTEDISLTLAGDEPIRGRLIDIEGRPAGGVTLHVRSVMAKPKTMGAEPDGVGYQGEKTTAAWFAPIQSDAEGRFTIRGIPAGHGVWLDVVANERFAPQDIALNTGLPEQRGERDGTYRSLVRNSNPGEELTLPLAPAQIFEGTIRYEDTKEPAAHARVNIWASQQKFGGSMVSVEGRADAQGRYRVPAKPGLRFGITAYPPDGAPYLIRRTDEDIRWEGGDRVKQADLTLPRGVLVRGQVVTATKGEPVAGASIQYLPEERNNPRAGRTILTGWQAIQLSDENGKFEIVVLPGPGRLLAHANGGSFVLQEIGSSVVSSGKPGGQRYYSHAIHKIDPQPGAETIDIKLELTPGTKIAGKIVDEAGQPVEEAIVVSRLNISPLSLFWRGDWSPALGGRFELIGLAEGVEYPTHVVDAKRRLGATMSLKANMGEPTVVLRPCGEAHVRFVDREGQPVAEFEPNLHLVVTPGGLRFDFKSLQAGTLAADEDYAANIDRLNHGGFPKADQQGRMTLRALIPGATYWILDAKRGDWRIAKEFQVEAGQMLDLGDVTVERQEK